MDQAQSLREYMQRFNVEQKNKDSSRVITITGGNGAVGKSNFTINFALGLKGAGKKVVIVDLSAPQKNFFIGTTPLYSLVDVLNYRKNIRDVLETGPEGIEYIFAGIEIHELYEIDQKKLSFFWSQIHELQNYADFILLDTGAGHSKELVDFMLSSDEAILVSTPEPTSITEVYTVVKTFFLNAKQSPKFSLVVNRALTYQEAVKTSSTLKNACNKFLKFDLKTLGYLIEDSHVEQSVRLQMPFLISYPNCSASKNIKQIVNSYLTENEKVSLISTK